LAHAWQYFDTLHVLGALYHGLWLRSGVMGRMLRAGTKG
jgi:cytochrome b561